MKELHRTMVSDAMQRVLKISHVSVHVVLFLGMGDAHGKVTQ
jgi:hypothetical protein